MSRGTAPVNAPEFFRSGAVGTFLTDIGNEYDLVLIDCPPLLHVAYASLLAKYADATLVVIPHRSSTVTAEDVRNRLDLIDVHVAGYVYNRAPLRPQSVGSEGSMKDVLGSSSST
jgi:tyrosine-protein kinase Etk/Wzc